MISPRRIAELGLLAASLVLVGSVAVVVVGASDGSKPGASQSSGTSLATAQLPGMSAASHR